MLLHKLIFWIANVLISQCANFNFIIGPRFHHSPLYSSGKALSTAA